MTASNLTPNDIGFFILLPGGSGISDTILQNLTARGIDQSIHIFISDWLVYETGSDQDVFTWQIPGIKLYFKNEKDFDKAKHTADQIMAELKEKTNLTMDLVYIDKARLAG